MSAIAETYLTLIGKPGSTPVAEGESIESDGERFIVHRVVVAANGSWQARAVPARVWRTFTDAMVKRP